MENQLNLMCQNMPTLNKQNTYDYDTVSLWDLFLKKLENLHELLII